MSSTDGQWSRSLEMFAYPVIGDRPVHALAVEHALEVLRPIWEAKTETAIRVRGRCEVIWAVAKARGWCSGENPFRWRGNLQMWLPRPGKVRTVEHHAALPWQHLPSFLAALAKQKTMSALALRFLILTAKRSIEVRGMRWGEIDMQAKVWTIPPPRMKAGREHREPLTDVAIDVLKRAKELDPELVFPGEAVRDGKAQPLSDMAFMALLRRMGRGDLTAHGFRSTFRDWAAETGKPADVAEAALAHVIRDKTVAAYQRSDILERRRELMEQWAEFCNRPAPASDEIAYPHHQKAAG